MIKTEHLTKKFGDLTALNDISCTINDGCIYGLVGSNGAGKSTLLRLIAGVYKPEKGNVTVDGAPVYENPKVKERITFVADELFFLPGASMNRMADLYAAVYKRFDRKRYKELTSLFGLDPKKPINTFSKGMKRQAATILALSARSDYILFDETFDGLDPVMRNFVKKNVCEDILDRNATAVITSHSLRELEDTCDQLALLHKGGLILQSDVQNLKTGLFKVQVAFREEYDKTKFEGMNILQFIKHGMVANMIIRGDQEKTVARLKAMNPAVLDVLPLTLEEVFTYEMEALGYKYSLES